MDRETPPSPARWFCRICGFCYDEATRGPIPADYVCPLCGAGREQFEGDE